jgi:hypothetical protein
MYVHFILPGNGRPLAMLRAILKVAYHRLATRAMIQPRPPRPMNSSLTRQAYDRREDAICALVNRLEGDILCTSQRFARCCQSANPCPEELAKARHQLNLHLAQAQAVCSVHGFNLEIMGRESFIHRLFDAVDKANDALDEATHYLDSL